MRGRDGPRAGPFGRAPAALLGLVRAMTSSRRGRLLTAAALAVVALSAVVGTVVVVLAGRGAPAPVPSFLETALGPAAATPHSVLRPAKVIVSTKA